MEPVGRDPRLLSRAIVVWTGWGRASSPRREDAAVIREFGESESTEILAAIRQLEGDFYESTAALTIPDLVAATDTAAQEFRDQHPGLSEDAVQALAWCYSYDFK